MPTVHWRTSSRGRRPASPSSRRSSCSPHRFSTGVSHVTADDLAALAERAARTITGGGGLKALAQLLADAVHGSVLVEDEQWRHLAIAQFGDADGAMPATFAPHHDRAGAADGLVRAKIDESVFALCAPMPGGSQDTSGAAGYVTLFVRGKVPGHA